jgi:hypothetical protein
MIIDSTLLKRTVPNHVVRKLVINCLNKYILKKCSETQERRRRINEFWDWEEAQNDVEARKNNDETVTLVTPGAASH